MPSPNYSHANAQQSARFQKLFTLSQPDPDLALEIRKLRKEMAELRSILSTPSSIIITGDAVRTFMLQAQENSL